MFDNDAKLVKVVSIIFGIIFFAFLSIANLVSIRKIIYGEKTVASDKLVFCDLDGDKDCDAHDYELADKAIGVCDDSSEYVRTIDTDDNGCITREDLNLIFPVASTSSGYVKPQIEQLFYQIIKRLDN